MGRIAWVAAVVAALAAFTWWYALDGSTPEQSDFSYRLDELRVAAAAPPAERPASIAIEVVGEGSAPAFAAIGGLDFGKRRFDYASFRIGYANGRSVIVDTAADRDIIENVLGGRFDKAAYDRLIKAMAAADTILVTHEHIDHLPVVARYPDPKLIAPKLKLTLPEVAALPAFATDHFDESLARLPAADFTNPTRIAPGVAALATPGHTKGHSVFYVQKADGTEYLMVGDIVWLMDSVTGATTRPRFLQTFFFDPPEDRPMVQQQVRALHDLAKAEPALVILPAHDADHIDALVKAGKLSKGF